MRAGRFLVVLFVVALLFSCGGGGGGGNLSSSGTVSVLVTDDISTEYSEAWITILKVTAVSADSQEYVLYEDPAGSVFNLMELSGVGRLLNIATLPPGTYHNIKVTLKNEIVLVDKSGNTVTAAFSPAGDTFVMDVAGSLVVNPGQSTYFALDFDVKQFNYDPDTGLVSTVVVFKPEHEVKSLNSTHAKIEGYVVEVLSSNSFTMQIEHSSTVVTVTLSASAVVFDEHTGATASDTSLLQPSQKVDVYGVYDPETLTIEAVSVKIESSSEEHTYRVKAEGVVESVDGATVVLDVKEAKNFVPPENTILVDLSTAVFSKGSLEDLKPGQWIEVKGTWDGSTLVATVAEIEGHPSSGNGNGNQNANENANHNGNQNENHNGNENANHNGNENANHNGNENANHNGNENANHNGNKNANHNGNTNANQNINTNQNANHNGNRNSNVNGSAEYVEVYGTVTGVSGSVITVSISSYKHFVPSSDSIDVDVSTAWFKNGTSADLVSGVKVEIKGSWNGTILIATVVEIES